MADKLDQLSTQVQVMQSTLDRVELAVKQLNENDVGTRISIAVLKTKTMFWGGLSGGIMTFIIMLLGHYLTSAK